MSRTKLQRALHVRVHDAGNSPTVDVRFYTQSDGVPLTSCIGTLRCSHQFFHEVLRPLIRKGAEQNTIPYTLDVRPRGEHWRMASDVVREGPTPFPDAQRLGVASSPPVPYQPPKTS